MIRGLQKRINYVEWIIPIIYGLVICVYPFPKTFDVYRFLKFYRIFEKEKFLSPEQVEILGNSPDILAKIILLVLAQLGWPIEIFLFSSAYITGLLFLYVFKRIYQSINGIIPTVGLLLLVYFLLPVDGILSGVRNMNAWGFVFLGLLMLEQGRKKRAYLSLFYASLVHYASYIFLPFFYFQKTIKNYSINKILKYAGITSLVLFIFLFCIEHNFFYILGEALYKKIHFYFYKSELLLSVFNRGKYIVFIYMFLKIYLPFLASIYFLWKEQPSFKESLLIKSSLFLSLLFVFFPDIMFRYALFFRLAMLFYLLSTGIYKQNIIAKICLYLIVLFVFLEQGYFWIKVAYHHWY